MAQAARKHKHMGHGNYDTGLNKQFAANDPRYDQGHHHHKHKSAAEKIVKGGLKMAFMAASFAIGGYAGSLLFDPFFFTPVHDPNNVAARMIEEFATQNFGWIHDMIGLTGGNGWLQSDFVLNTLGMAEYIEATPNQVAETLTEGVSNADVSAVQDMTDDELFGPD